MAFLEFCLRIKLVRAAIGAIVFVFSLQIERIQNKSLYEQYVAKKGKILKANPNITVEKTLWHGTSFDTVQSINNYGFNRSYCGKNGKFL